VAQKLFRRAIKLRDGNYPRAWGHLSYTALQADIFRWGTSPDQADLCGVQADPKNARKTALKYAKEAVKRDPGDYDNHWSLGVAQLYASDHGAAKTAYDEAIRLAEKAYKAEPHQIVPAVYWDLRAERAEFLFLNGEAGDAVKELETAIKQKDGHHPKWYWWDLSWAYFELAEDEPKKREQHLTAALNALDNIKHLPDVVLKNKIAAMWQRKAGFGANDDQALAGSLANDYNARNPDDSVAFEARWPYRHKSRLERWQQTLIAAGLKA
jgi:tetratricopeptide (TPR) repeat protein